MLERHWIVRARVLKDYHRSFRNFYMFSLQFYENYLRNLR
jgi:hypothetical protein